MKYLLCFIVLYLEVSHLAAQKQDSFQDAYVFAYFTDKDQTDGLHLAYSHDGLQWEALCKGQSMLKPRIGKEKIMRDPSISQGPDGTFHLVWTCSWFGNGIGYAHSKDLIHWSEQQFLPIMEQVEGTKNCWAPEIFYDETTASFYIIWASTVKGRHNPIPHVKEEAYNNPRQYVTSTTDFVHFTPPIKLYDKGFAVIDAFVLKEKDIYYMFLKNENSLPTEKNIRMSTSPSIMGPYSEPTARLTSTDYWAEGASCLKVGDTFYLYYDRYKGKTGYGVHQSKDLKHWIDMTAYLKVPLGMKHGTPFRISQKALDALKSAQY